VGTELLYEVAGGVGTATINRPERRNALSWGVISGAGW
jgi:enoyl-CoA hydratase/carnithine racemase